MKKITAIIALATVFIACNEARETEETLVVEETAPTQVVHPEWSKNANIYEVNVRQYTPEGTFEAFEKHLPRLKEMGVDILWFMPIQPIGKLNRKGGMGSYYSISDYEAVNTDFGSLEDFNRIVETAHSLGMKVILDWVANHTSFDHKWVAKRPDFYTQDSLGNRPVVALDNDGKPTDWTDVADLNYNERDLMDAMTESMRFWVTASNIDGFRCDVAGFVPLEFWEVAIPKLKETKSDLFFLAEWEDPKLMSVFDMGYSWSFHHMMNEVAKGEKSPTLFNDYLKKLNTEFGPDNMQMMFTTNHDENSWNGTVFERMGENHKNMFVLATTFQNGMPLIYGGQEASLNKRLRFFEKDTISWKNTDLIPFYTQMLKLKHENKALWNGTAGGKMTLIETGKPDRVYAFYREKDENRVVVFLNFSDQAISFEPLLIDIFGSYFSLEGNSLDWATNPQLRLEANDCLIVTKN